MSKNNTVGSTRVPSLEEVMWFVYDLKAALGNEYALRWRPEPFPDFPDLSLQQARDIPIEDALVAVYHTRPSECRDYVRLLVGGALCHAATVNVGLLETLVLLRVARGIEPALVTHEILRVLLIRPYCGESQAVLVGRILRLLNEWGTSNVLVQEEWCRLADVVFTPDIATLIKYQQGHVHMVTAERERFYEVLRERIAREEVALRNHGQAADQILKMLG